MDNFSQGCSWQLFVFSVQGPISDTLCTGMACLFKFLPPGTGPYLSLFYVTTLVTFLSLWQNFWAKQLRKKGSWWLLPWQVSVHGDLVPLLWFCGKGESITVDSGAHGSQEVMRKSALSNWGQDTPFKGTTPVICFSSEVPSLYLTFGLTFI